MRRFLSFMTRPLLWLTEARWSLRLGRRGMLRVTLEQDMRLVQRAAMLTALRRAGRDPRVKAILLDVRAIPGGWAFGDALRGVLEEVRGTGTGVYMYLEEASLASLWLASAADRIWMPPLAHVLLQGVSSTMLFVGGVLSRYGVEVEFEAVGDYKSAAERFARTHPTPKGRLATQELLSDLQARVVHDIADGRRIDEVTIASAMRRSLLTADEAVSAGLIDRIGYRDAFDDWLEEHHGGRLRRVSFAIWQRRTRFLKWSEGLRSRAAVAVVHLEGTISASPGEAGRGISPEATERTLERLREHPGVSAVVLHINSPGGSAEGSDRIARSVERLAEEKPVVAVYADVSASGGVMLSSPATEVIAHEATITGSIGVIGGKVMVGRALGRLGLHAQSVQADAGSGMLSPYRRFTEAERSRFRSVMEETYRAFVERVATGRGLSVDAVEPHCGGRVWTGRAALERELVDRLGGLEEGVRSACRLCGVLRPDTQVLHVEPNRGNVVQRARQRFGLRMRASAWGALSGRFLEADLATLALVQDRPGAPLCLSPWVVDRL